MARIVVAIVVGAAAIAAVVVDGEPELTLFMAVAVVVALAAFDGALDRQAQASWPWLLVAAAVLGAAVPRVLSRIADETGVAAERSAHVSSVLFGGCIAIASFVVARPPRRAEHRLPLSTLLVLAPLIGGVAGAAAGHAGAGRLGSERAARIFESLGWAGAATVVVAIPLGVALLRRPPRSYALFALGALASALVVARRAAGHDDDLGWSAVAFVLLGMAPLLIVPARLGHNEERRPSAVPAIGSVLLGVLAAQGAILTLNRDLGWQPGAVALTVLAIASLAAGAPLFRWGHRSEEATAGTAELVIGTIARTRLEVEPLPIEDAPTDPWPAEVAPEPRVEVHRESYAFRAATGVDRHTTATPTEIPEVTEEPTEAEIPPAADVTAATVPTGSMAGNTAPPHLVDPSTGLRSAAGLQQSLVDAFGRSRGAGEVSMLMVAMRNLDEVERSHGRVVSAQVVAELARRFERPLTDAAVARFATDGFAALIDGPAIDAEVLVNRCTDVLLDLLDPVQVGDVSVEIDVAAGMAQCYAGEDVATFVARGEPRSRAGRAVNRTHPGRHAMTCGVRPSALGGLHD